MRRLHPDFVGALRATPLTFALIARYVGLYPQRFSALANGRHAPDTALTNDRIHRIADLIGWPRGGCFVQEERHV